MKTRWEKKKKGAVRFLIFNFWDQIGEIINNNNNKNEKRKKYLLIFGSSICAWRKLRMEEFERRKKWHWDWGLFFIFHLLFLVLSATFLIFFPFLTSPISSISFFPFSDFSEGTYQKKGASKWRLLWGSWGVLDCISTNLRTV